jgi:hypothetical protein
MTKEVVATEVLEMDALTLGDFVTTHITNDHSDDKTVVYVQDDEGRIFERVTLIKETLTDGSHVYNLILGNEVG